MLATIGCRDFSARQQDSRGGNVEGTAKLIQRSVVHPGMAQSEPHDATQPETDRPRENHVGQRRTVLALGLAVAALVLAIALPLFLVPRPGAPVMSRKNLNLLPGGVTLAPAPACTHVAGAEVAINVPSAGTIVVTATGRLSVNHTWGIADTISIFLGNATTSCAYPYAWIGEIPASWPSEQFMDVTYSLQTSFTVSRAGTFTLYLNGHMWEGGDAADRVLTASMVAVFYPS